MLRKELNVGGELCTLRGGKIILIFFVFVWAQQSFDCSEYRDIPLLNLANIFHQGRHSRDAAIILHAAVDHAPQEPIHYQALGNVYAVLAEYNRSISCYENVLKLRPTVRDVSHAKSAVLCHQRLESELMELHK